MRAGLTTLIAAVASVGMPGSAFAATYTIGEPIGCDIPVAALMSPEEIHRPNADVSADRLVYSFGFEERILIQLRQELGARAPQGSYIELGTAEIDPWFGEVRLGRHDTSPAPIDCLPGPEQPSN